jgi:hypothetical protein
MILRSLCDVLVIFFSCLLHNFLMRLPYEISCLLQMLSAAHFSCKISVVDITLFFSPNKDEVFRIMRFFV